MVFTQGLVADLIRTFDGENWHLSLVDIDPKALNIVYRICKKMLEAKKSDIRLDCSTDRCEALPGSDYVITTIGVGGRRAWEKDVLIPRKYGIFQPVGDSVMPGGISRAMRMIPAMVGIAKDIEKLCPNARFFNYANPMTMSCRAVWKATGFPVTGLCHGVTHSEHYLQKFAGVGRDKATSYAVGLNHLTFIYDFRYDGRDLFPELRKRLAEIEKAGVDYTYVGRGFAEYDKPEPPLDEPFSWELFKTCDAFPAPGDRHVAEYFAERFVNKGSYYGKTLGIDAYSFEQTIESGDEEYARMEKLADDNAGLPESFFNRFSGEHEQLTNIILSIEHDSRKIFYSNVPNNGTVPQLPASTVLEMPAAATAFGMLPLQLKDLPEKLAPVISKHAAIVETAVEAALKGDKGLFAEAVLMGGYISDKAAVEKMVNEMIDAQMDYLPQFK